MLEFRTSDKETEAEASRCSIKENLQKLFRKVVQKALQNSHKSTCTGVSF